METSRDVKGISLTTTAVTSSEDGDGATKEIVLQRGELMLPSGGLARLNVQRLGQSVRHVADQACLALMQADGEVLAKTTQSMNPGETVSITVESDLPTEVRLVAAVKLVRVSSLDETHFFDTATREPRLRAWVDVQEPLRQECKASVVLSTKPTSSAVLSQSLPPGTDDQRSANGTRGKKATKKVAAPAVASDLTTFVASGSRAKSEPKRSPNKR